MFYASDLTKNFFRYAEGLSYVRSPGDLWEWFMWVHPVIKIIFALGTIGILALIYIFIIAMFKDNQL